MGGVAHAHGHGNSNASEIDGSWRAIQRFQGVLRRDDGRGQDGQSAEFNAALYNVAALWASQPARPSHAENTSHRDAVALLVESLDVTTRSDMFASPRM